MTELNRYRLTCTIAATKDAINAVLQDYTSDGEEVEDLLNSTKLMLSELDKAVEDENWE